MQRMLSALLLLSLSAQTQADCELPFAPSEVRATALTFHHAMEKARQERPHGVEPKKASRKTNAQVTRYPNAP
jgi:hypothetical protein